MAETDYKLDTEKLQSSTNKVKNSLLNHFKTPTKNDLNKFKKFLETAATGGAGYSDKYNNIKDYAFTADDYQTLAELAYRLGETVQKEATNFNVFLDKSSGQVQEEVQKIRDGYKTHTLSLSNNLQNNLKKSEEAQIITVKFTNELSTSKEKQANNSNPIIIEVEE